MDWCACWDTTLHCGLDSPTMLHLWQIRQDMHFKLESNSFTSMSLTNLFISKIASTPTTLSLRNYAIILPISSLSYILLISTFKNSSKTSKIIKLDMAFTSTFEYFPLPPLSFYFFIFISLVIVYVYK